MNGLGCLALAVVAPAGQATAGHGTGVGLPDAQVVLNIEVEQDQVDQATQRAYQSIVNRVNIPGFRRGKVPAAVIDQRVGRGTVLNEAVQEAIPQNILAAVREHDLKTLGRPEVEITEFNDGDSLNFTAEVDVRPEITLPDPATIEVTVAAVMSRERTTNSTTNNLVRGLKSGSLDSGVRQRCRSEGVARGIDEDRTTRS